MKLTHTRPLVSPNTTTVIRIMPTRTLKEQHAADQAAFELTLLGSGSRGVAGEVVRRTDYIALVMRVPRAAAQPSVRIATSPSPRPAA